MNVIKHSFIFTIISNHKINHKIILRSTKRPPKEGQQHFFFFFTILTAIKLFEN